MSNKKLETMTKLQQRVAIAENILKLIHSGRIKAKSGVYLRKLKARGWPKCDEKCCACVVGALFVSKYQLFGGDWDEPIDADYGDRLSPYFSDRQLDKMENAFEGPRLRDQGLSNDDYRMMAIMQNLIDHHGTYKPSVVYEVA